MSMIHVISRKAGPANEVGDLSLLAQTSGSEKPSHDGDMMYAWSIGVTDAARESGNVQRQAELENAECPPEVFIG